MHSSLINVGEITEIVNVSRREEVIILKLCDRKSRAKHAIGMGKSAGVICSKIQENSAQKY